MSDDPTTPKAPSGPAAGEESEEESGAGYGNHAPDVGEEPAEAERDAR